MNKKTNLLTRGFKILRREEQSNEEKMRDILR